MAANDNDDKHDVGQADEPYVSPHIGESSKFVETLSGKFEEFRVAIQGLEGAGCDPIRIGWLLRAVVGLKGKRAVSREEMQAYATQFEECGKAIWKLLSSQASPLLGSETVGLGIGISKLSRGVAALAPQTDRRKETATYLAIASLIKYAHDRTGEFRDDDLASLISVAMLDAGLRTTDYTTAAHRQWRSRESHTRFTEGSGQELVNELLEEMEDEL